MRAIRKKTVLLLNFNSSSCVDGDEVQFLALPIRATYDMQLMALTEFHGVAEPIQKVYLLNRDYAFGQSVAARRSPQADKPDRSAGSWRHRVR